MGYNQRKKIKERLSNTKGKVNQDLGERGIKGGGLDDAIGSIGGTAQI